MTHTQNQSSRTGRQNIQTNVTSAVGPQDVFFYHHAESLLVQSVHAPALTRQLIDASAGDQKISRESYFHCVEKVTFIGIGRSSWNSSMPHWNSSMRIHRTHQRHTGIHQWPHWNSSMPHGIPQHHTGIRLALQEIRQCHAGIHKEMPHLLSAF